MMMTKETEEETELHRIVSSQIAEESAPCIWHAHIYASNNYCIHIYGYDIVTA
jgi:hypothetical protein